jgi:hypothetical protein
VKDDHLLKLSFLLLLLANEQGKYFNDFTFLNDDVEVFLKSKYSATDVATYAKD